jgi:preprotein translocase subunit SecG
MGIQALLLVLHILVGLGVVGLVLLQHGKGADMGAAFGSGASGTIFGSRGSASFLSRTTAALATVFFLNSMVLAYLASHREGPTSVIERVQLPAPVEVPEVAPREQASDVPMAPADVPKPPGG